MSNVTPLNRIYLTYKARIVAEEKLRLISRISNYLIIWYSFLLIVASVADLSKIFKIEYFGLISASASIAIFASSIFLATGTLEKKADQFRLCYLALQNLYNSSLSEEIKMAKYAEILSNYPNHSTRDDSDFRLSVWLRKGSLYDTKGEIKFGIITFASTIIRKFVFWVLICILFAGPLWLAPKYITIS